MNYPHRIRNSVCTAALIAVSAVIFSPVASRATILQEEGGQGGRSVRPRSAIKTAEDGITLRRLRRVGVGLQAAGTLGVGGAAIELCFKPETGFVGGFGGGRGFQTFTLQYKQILGGQSFLPYFAAGFSRWYNIGQPTPVTDGTSPSILTERLLTESEKSRGAFGVNLVHPALGVQIVQLSGPYAGASVFAEAVMLMRLETFVAAPTGSVGFLYYF